MQWFNDIVDWATSERGSTVITTAVLPFLAIVLAGVLAALIARGAVKRLIRQRDRDDKAAVLAALVAAARRASSWSSLTGDERRYAETLASDADIRLRLLPVPGAEVAANWAAHEIAELRRHSVHYSTSDQAVVDFRDRLVEWEFRPRRARKQFQFDLERWRFEKDDADLELETRQDAWASEHRAPESRATGSRAPESRPVEAPRAGAAAETPAPAPRPASAATPASAPAPAPAAIAVDRAEPAPKPPVGENGLDADGLQQTQALQPVGAPDGPR